MPEFEKRAIEALNERQRNALLDAFVTPLGVAIVTHLQKATLNELLDIADENHLDVELPQDSFTRPDFTAYAEEDMLYALQRKIVNKCPEIDTIYPEWHELPLDLLSLLQRSLRSEGQDAERRAEIVEGLRKKMEERQLKMD